MLFSFLISPFTVEKPLLIQSNLPMVNGLVSKDSWNSRHGDFFVNEDQFYRSYLLAFDSLLACLYVHQSDSRRSFGTVSVHAFMGLRRHFLKKILNFLDSRQAGIQVYLQRSTLCKPVCSLVKFGK